MSLLSSKRALYVLTLAAVIATTLATGASCGSRTGLAPEPLATGGDAEAGSEADVPEEPPGIDARPDVPVVNPCPDASATLVYVVGLSNEVYSFDPTSGGFTPIGKLACPDSSGTQPFSMAVNRQGTAYVLFNNINSPGNATAIYRVNLKTLECAKTKYDPTLNGGLTFGMSFVANVPDGGAPLDGGDADGGDGGDVGEQLYVALDLSLGGAFNTNGKLAIVDTTTFKLNTIGLFSPSVDGSELTGTGDGRLFAFAPAMKGSGQESFIAEIDPRNARVIGEDPLPGVFRGGGWAFGFWGGDFYTFTGIGSRLASYVYRYDPVAKSLVQLTELDTDLIVGAGVSTCAPD